MASAPASCIWARDSIRAAPVRQGPTPSPARSPVPQSVAVLRPCMLTAFVTQQKKSETAARSWSPGLGGTSSSPVMATGDGLALGEPSTLEKVEGWSRQQATPS